MIIQAAYLEITNICNLNCRSCYNRSGVPHPKKELAFADFQQLVTRLIEEFGCKRISLSGGEPTLHSRFSDMLSYLLSHPEVTVSVVTNGTTENKALLQAFQHCDNLYLQTSLDGSTEEINAKTRGKGNFEKTLAWLRQLGPSARSKVKMVVSGQNISDIGNFYALVASLGCIPGFDFINSLGNAREQWDFIALSAQQKLKALKEIKALNQAYGIDSALPFCTSYCPLSDVHAAHSVLIKSDGTTMPCQMLYDSRYAVGNLLTDPEEVLEQGFWQMEQIVKTRIATDYGCQTCVAKNFCKKGCPAFGLQLSGDLLANDGECTFRKLQLLGFHALEEHDDGEK